MLFEPYSASVTGMLRATASRNALSVKGSHARVARESALTGVKYIRNTFVTVTELSVTRTYSVTLCFIKKSLPRTEGTFFVSVSDYLSSEKYLMVRTIWLV